MRHYNEVPRLSTLAVSSSLFLKYFSGTKEIEDFSEKRIEDLSENEIEDEIAQQERAIKKPTEFLNVLRSLDSYEEAKNDPVVKLFVEYVEYIIETMRQGLRALQERRDELSTPQEQNDRL